MNREFQKEIHVRSRLRSKYLVEPSAQNKAACKKQKKVRQNRKEKY